jgi:hypothetical protein
MIEKNKIVLFLPVSSCRIVVFGSRPQRLGYFDWFLMFEMIYDFYRCETEDENHRNDDDHNSNEHEYHNFVHSDTSLEKRESFFEDSHFFILIFYLDFLPYQ